MQRTLIKIATASLALLGLAQAADAQFSLSKLFINPPGTDGGQEAVEIRGPASTSLSGWSFLVVEGDASNAGIVDVSQDLSAFSTGSNGILLIRDAGTVISPAPDGATSVAIFDWNPDIENGSNTFVLGNGTAPAQGSDFDANNDGVFDVAGFTASFTVADTFGWKENDTGSNLSYAALLGGVDVGPFTSPAFNPDCFYRLWNASSPCSWAGGDVTGTNPGGPYSFDFAGGRVFGFAEQGITATFDVNLGSNNLVPDADGDGLANLCDGCPNDASKGAPGLCGCGIPEGCTLGRDLQSIVPLNGGIQTLSLFAGAANAGDLYLLLGSFAGTSPGLPVDSVVLPLNLDDYLLFMVSNPNSVVSPSLGFLNGLGQATAVFNVPASTSIGGLPLVVNHAYLVVDLSTFTVVLASNAADCTLLP